MVEDMLQACILDFLSSQEDHLPVVEFLYNSNYHSITEMAPFEALYGQPYCLPSCQLEASNGALMGPNIVLETTEKVEFIRKHTQYIQRRQKSYDDGKGRMFVY